MHHIIKPCYACVNWAICTESSITPSVVVLCLCVSWVVLNHNLRRIYNCIRNVLLSSPLPRTTMETHWKIGCVQMIWSYLPTSRVGRDKMA